MKIPYLLTFILFVAFGDQAAAQRLATNYGSAVAVANGQILVGEPDNRYRPGTVYVYARAEDGSWTERDALTASDGEFFDGFGSSLAASGEQLAVGAMRQNGGKGGAYVFEHRGDRWIESGRLVAAEAEPAEKFGSAIALDGDIIAVGAPATTRYGRLTPATKPGAVYVFTRDAESDSWSLDTRLEGSGAEIGATFGAAVAVQDDRIFVGAPMQENGTGAVYVFELTDQGWMETDVLRSSLASDRAQLGAAIAVSGDTLLAGAPMDDRARGAVSVFGWNGQSSAWEEEQRLLPFDGPSRAFFGSSVSVDADRIWTGAPLINSGRGDAYGFDARRLKSAIRIEPDSVAEGTYFGTSIAFRGDVGAVSIPEGDGLEGVVAALEPDDDGRWHVRSLLRGRTTGLEPITGERTECRDGKAAIFDCRRVDLISFLPVRSLGGSRGTRMNDLWGWTDDETGREYVIAGRTDGTAFVDITDPSNPVYLGNLPLTQGAQPTTWRDMKVYRNHAFIVADGTPNHGMQVFDLTRLRDVADLPALFTEDAIYAGLENSHNVAINEESGFAYAVGGDRCGGGLHMIDIRDPLTPTFAGCFTHYEAGNGSTHDTQCVMYKGPDTEHSGREICFSSNGSAFSIADVTEKESPQAISSASFPNHAYIHQGWLTDDQRYFYMNDELDEFVGNVDQTRTLIWDVSDLEDPQLVAEYLFGSTSADHNLYINDSYMYQSNYLSGLHIHDISDPERPREIAHFDTVPVGENTSRLDGSWSNYPYFESGIIPVSSKDEGLFLLKMRDDPGL